MTEFHEPVMVREVTDLLCSAPSPMVLDCTLGDGGHSLAVLGRSTGAFVVGIDVDSEAIGVAERRLRGAFPGRFIVRRGDYRELPGVLAWTGVPSVDGVLFDLGVSSRQLDLPHRGFSYWNEGPLDMRMDRESPLTAKDIVNTWSEEEIRRIVREYGEERFAARIAKSIVKARERHPIQTTRDLAQIIEGAVPGNARRQPIHPARRTFQALRIAVNGELSRLGRSLLTAFELLRPRGVMVVLSYHSLEDRIAKNAMRSLADQGRAEILTKKPMTASEMETSSNPRSRSAKLRALLKLE